MSAALLKIEIKYEHDVVLARQRARQIAGLLGFEPQDQVRIATAVSEMARNAYRYAGGGKVEFFVSETVPQDIRICVSDAGPGIADLKSVLNGTYVSQTGLGMGIIGVKRLMDACEIESAVNKGTRIECSKSLPKNAKKLTAKLLSDIAKQLAAQLPQDPFEEIQRQNQELLSALAEVQKQKTEMAQLNRELEETNRGVVALYAELDERAEELRRVSDLKTQFLSNMTHEFRTPLNSMLSISQILLDRLDGDLTGEQEKQVNFIRTAANDLSMLVNDLLDLAKVEAGKISVRPTTFYVPEIFGMLRGMLKPLLEQGTRVSLVFDDPMDIPALQTDEGKLSQILRNFISNGLKYTEKGEVKVNAYRETDNYITFSVKDTGIGIAPEDQEKIFEEFIQIEGAHQKKTKGTGLGLPLSKKLAELLGGYVSVTSEPGKGSVFSVTVPLHYNGPKDAVLADRKASARLEKGTPCRFLIIDDNETDRYIFKRLLAGCSATIFEASGGKEGLATAGKIMPEIIFLDLIMPDISGFEMLKKLKSNMATSGIPVVIHTSRELSGKESMELEEAAAIVSKGKLNAREWAGIITKLEKERNMPRAGATPSFKAAHV